MKSIKEIRKEADFLYSKSSHYLGSLFILVGAITGVATAVLDGLGVELNLIYLPLLVVLFAPFQYGTIKAALLSYERKAKDVKALEYGLMGLKKINKSFLPFVGPMVIIYGIKMLIVGSIAYLISISSTDFINSMIATLTGNIDYIYSSNSFLIASEMVIAIIVAFILGMLLECYFGISYYFAVENQTGLIESLKSSVKVMRGNVWKLIKLRLSFLFQIFITFVVLAFVRYFLTDIINGWFQLMNTSKIFLDLIINILYGIISAIISVMVYRLKEQIALVVFYKELTKE